MTLQQRRYEWEKTLTPVAEANRDEDTFLVVLKDIHGKYRCHRYFAVSMLAKAADWVVSVDHQEVDADTAIRWLAEKLEKRLKKLRHPQCMK